MPMITAMLVTLVPTHLKDVIFGYHSGSDSLSLQTLKQQVIFRSANVTFSFDHVVRSEVEYTVRQRGKLYFFLPLREVISKFGIDFNSLILDILPPQI